MRVLGPAAGGLGVQTDVLRSPPTRGARVTWALLDGVGTGFWGRLGGPRHRMAIPSRGDNEERLRCGAEVLKKPTCLARRLFACGVLLQHERGFLPNKNRSDCIRRRGGGC